MSCTHGAACRIAIGGKHFGFTKFDPHGVVAQLVDGSPQTIHGHLERDAHMATDGPVLLNFDIHTEITWQEFSELLPFLGFTQSGVDWDINDVPTVQDILVDYDWTVHEFGDALIGKILFTGQKGVNPCKLVLGCYAKAWDIDAVWAADAIDSDAPYAFHNTEGLCDLEDVADAEIDRFAILIDRHVQVEHNNHKYPTDTCPADTEVTFASSVPFTEYQGGILLSTGLASSAGKSVSLGFEAGTKQTIWQFNHAKQIVQGIPIPLKQLIRKGNFYRCYADHVSGTLVPTLTITHDLSV